jgi:hypothetical protein
MEQLMTTVRKRVDLAAPADRVWDARRDFHAVHTRLVPGFVVDSTPDGDGCTFVWTDVLPDELADAIEPMMARGAEVLKETLDSLVLGADRR